MKGISTHLRQIFLTGTVALSLVAAAQTELRVDGRNLKAANGNTIILRGVNSGLAEDGNYDLADLAACKNYIDQIAQSGANAIRFTWYIDGVSWRDGGAYVNGVAQPEARYHKGNGTVMSGYIENGNLSDIFDYCKTKNIIPVLAIHDLTCANDWNYFNNDLRNWWLKPSVVALINAHKDHIVINLANEFGYMRYNNNDATDLNTFKINYGALVAGLRTVGVKVPIMIDAPDCGQSITELMSISANLLTADTEHNIIFSTHLYWGAGYAETPTAIGNKLNESVTANVCLALGEISSKQDDNGCGTLDISAIYQSALTQACPLGISWFAWSWDQDCTNARNMTTDGNYSTLTTFGSDIINNATYGLKSANCGATAIATAINSVNQATVDVLQYQFDISTITFKQTGTYHIYNMQGQEITAGNCEPSSVAHLSSLTNGVYVVQFIDKGGVGYNAKVIR